MLSRLFIKLFGTIWNLKKLCNTDNPGFLTRIQRFIYNAYQFEHGSAISYKTAFEEVPHLPHGMKQIIISEDVKIGKNCVIFQQVTIENDPLADSEASGSPIIGDNCSIYPGAKIIGKVVVGDNVRIAPNAVVMQNIPSNSFVSYADQKIKDLKEKTTDLNDV